MKITLFSLKFHSERRKLTYKLEAESMVMDKGMDISLSVKKEVNLIPTHTHS